MFVSSNAILKPSLFSSSRLLGARSILLSGSSGGSGLVPPDLGVELSLKSNDDTALLTTVTSLGLTVWDPTHFSANLLP